MKQKALPNRHSLGRTLQLNILLAGSKANFEIINPHFHKKSHWIKKLVKNQDSKFPNWLLDPVCKKENENVQNLIFREFPIHGIWFSSD